MNEVVLREPFQTEWRELLATYVGRPTPLTEARRLPRLLDPADASDVADVGVDDRILVRSHLIRAADEAHVWVNAARMEDSEAALQSTVSSRIAAAVASKTQPAR